MNKYILIVTGFIVLGFGNVSLSRLYEKSEITQESEVFYNAIITDPNGTTNIRSGKGTKNQIIYKLKTNEKFLVSPDVSKWWKVIILETNEKGYIYSDRVSIIRENLKGNYTEASNYYLKENDLINLSKKELQVMRYEIIARYGYAFKKGGKIRNYFDGFQWYNPISRNVDSKLTQLEKYNFNLIKNIEKGNINYKYNKEDFYIISVDASSSEYEAIEKVKNLKSQGYNSDYLWIAQYSSLSGSNLYSVFIGPYFDINECAIDVEEYRKTNPSAYGILVSSNSTERIEIRGPGKIIKK